jgi:predicted membrane channel-forming protein YqfA (hemolysin III family)
MEVEEEDKSMEVAAYVIMGFLLLGGMWPLIFVAGVLSLPFRIAGGVIRLARRVVRQ